jgi:putative restriction endonuclease
MTNMEQAIERLYDLNVGTVGSGLARHERPHKPVLMLAVLDLIATGQVTPQHIAWSRDLRTRFTEYFDQVHQLNDDNTPENPFFYLRGDGFWQPLVVSDGADLPLECTPTVADATAGRVFARLINGFEECVRENSQRMRLRGAVISRYFPKRREQLEATTNRPAPSGLWWRKLKPRVMSSTPRARVRTRFTVIISGF